MTNNNFKTCIVIPVYNCANSIDILLSNLIDIFDRSQLVLVDDGSSDNSIEIIEKYCVKLIKHKKNLGKGSALISGYQAAFDLGFTHAVSMDSDLQHDPNDLSKFFIEEDLVLGARSFTFGLMPIARIFSNSLSSILLSLVCRRWIADGQCGYRKVPLKEVLNSKLGNIGYQYESELLIELTRKYKFKPISVKVKTIYDVGEESHIKHVNDTLDFISLFFRKIL